VRAGPVTSRSFPTTPASARRALGAHAVVAEDIEPVVPKRGEGLSLRYEDQICAGAKPLPCSMI